MNRFLATLVFTRVAESGGFTAASRKLGMSVSSITKSVARLEDELGVQLLNRTTRRMALKDYGQEFYERSVRILAELEDAEAAMREANLSPRGRVRVVMPFSFGRVTLVPALGAFYARYPDITLDLNFSDVAVDLIEAGYDVAVRTAEVRDARLVTRMLTRGPQITAASPKYLAEHGVPQHPEDLQKHNCIVSRFGPEWSYRTKQGRELKIRVGGNLVIWSGDAVREAAAVGLGIVNATWWLLRKDLEAGVIIPILDEYVTEGAPVSVYYPVNRHLPAKVKAFIDFLIDITQEG